VARGKCYYKQPGGVIGFPRRVLRSPAYRDLSLMARCMMLELQDVWSPANPVVHYSTRRAAESLSVSVAGASRAFKELRDHGFVKTAEESDWLNGKARVYALTWLPNGSREPTNEWQAWSEKTSPTFHPCNGQGSNRFTGVTVAENASDRPTKNQRLRRVSG